MAITVYRFYQLTCNFDCTSDTLALDYGAIIQSDVSTTLKRPITVTFFNGPAGPAPSSVTLKGTVVTFVWDTPPVAGTANMGVSFEFNPS